jgi:hypothetical protein
MESARQLEEKLISFKHPIEVNILNPGDGLTPVWHLSTIAEIYRSAGLIQLYRTFPDLLSKRLAAEDPTFLFNSFAEPETYQYEPLWLQDIAKETIIKKPQAVGNDWLTDFALTALGLLQILPDESRTRCLQPFLIVAISGELRLPSDLSHGFGEEQIDVAPQFYKVSNMRKFVIARLTSYLRILPPKPIQVCLKIVQSTWKRMDAGEKEVFWMDVMIENGWETTMG